MGYQEIIYEFKQFFTKAVYDLIYMHKIVSENAIDTVNNKSISVRYREDTEIAQYIQKLADTFYYLLKEKILRQCSIVFKCNETSKKDINYNIQIEQSLYSHEYSHVKADSLRDEFTKALIKLEENVKSIEFESTIDGQGNPSKEYDFAVYFFTTTKIKQPIVTGLGPQEGNAMSAYAYATPLLIYEEGKETPQSARDYIYSITLDTTSGYNATCSEIPLMQFYRC
ncbi:uncharacterized protein BBOV_IV011095 [Babesia bovis T2Bo]|uniref:uncharacterized protein n=1 Tax=Babesia bovis T2Bo TaxID=484906 RepID=UPI001DC32CDA|nr:uncharacterized protein BBOV_IV011095 [Babesia bovis T2Bo]KAG6439963.1 hypothetical protein BBOV_IV011095 [Babesia bovis T2Bo]